ncbi:signal transduction histidine kinase 5tm receptor lyts transmembrane region [Lucifera butyrica]|uniref:histidine kinase n=1 Tax=Lucifera butyrica TaxID=1351585 RepID=A0A498R8Q6_9FIRM|nr:LytS/YhcK type 5TM receptor domain-containing protein [Lucifera butyrica]VBB07317.1 signal transduction histidine kinase 5tm receptor lyts transmembrane region [Lucifera butyrica]
MDDPLIKTIISPINNVCVIMVMAYLMSHSAYYCEILDGKRTYKNQMLLLVTFGLFSLYAAAAGGVSNVRVLGPMLAGLLGGPVAGVGAGLFGGIYRFFDIRYAGAAEMANSALLATLLAGLAGGLVNRWKKGQLLGVWGTAGFAVAFEVFHMALTVAMGEQSEIVVATVKRVGIPMIISHAAGGAIFVFLTQNIINTRNIQSELQKSEVRFAVAFNLNPSPMIIKRVKDNRYVAVNDSFLFTFESKPEDIIGRKAEDLPFQFDRYDTFLRLLQKKKSVREFETHLRSKTGKVWVCLLFAELVNISGEMHVLSTIIDISERKRLEEKLLRLDRLNMVGQMAASVAHEIRNPLTAVRGYLQMLNMKEERSVIKERYDLMIKELDRTNVIISEYLLLAKDKVPCRINCCLNTIVSALLPLLQATAVASNCSIKLSLNDIPDLFLDEKEIRQLLLNLVRNGLEAMPKGGELAIRTFFDKNQAVLAISDQGPGVPPQIIEKLGTPFLTTKCAGTGLGLPICYRIALRHNASIAIETSPEGTTFAVRFNVIKNAQNDPYDAPNRKTG